MQDLIELFFSRQFEEQINAKMLYYNYTFPTEDVMSYINQVISIPIQALLNEIIQKEDEEEQISPKDVFQFSDFQDATITICNHLKASNDPGVTFIEAGKMLLNDGKYRNDVALRKYGENHLKTAEMLGLLNELSYTYFLSCIGYLFPELSQDTQSKLLVRLVLRDKLIRNLYCASQNGSVSVRQSLYMLSDSTYIRRRSNIKRILKILTESYEYDFSDFINKLRF